jgi:signal transduction histidine kinase
MLPVAGCERGYILPPDAMRKALGDILVEKGKLSAKDLERALAFQMREMLGREPVAADVTGFLLEVARTKYNQRERYYLGKILTELKLIPEQEVREALAAQSAAPAEKPRGRLEALREIMERMNSSYNLIELLHQILVLAAQLVEAESASLIVSDRARGCLVIVMPTGPGAQAVRDLEVPLGSGIAGLVHDSGRSVICNDPAHDPRFFAGIDMASGYTTRQLLCVPLTVKGRRLGAIEVINKTPAAGQRQRGFTAADRWLLELFSAQAAVATENTRLAMSLAQAEEDLGRQSTDLAAARMAHAGSLVARSFLEQMRRSLVPLQGYAGRMLERLDDERLRKYQLFIDREMRGLISRADDVSRFLQDVLRPALCADSLVGVLRELQARAWVDCRTSGIVFQLDVQEDAALLADRELLLAGLGALFRNSREAMTEGGTFTVRAAPQGTSVAIEIEDTGPGITIEPVEKALELFVTRGKPHGAGLGLPLARKIVELHGGTLAVSNRGVPTGARVRITLPLG